MEELFYEELIKKLKLRILASLYIYIYIYGAISNETDIPTKSTVVI